MRRMRCGFCACLRSASRSQADALPLVLHCMLLRQGVFVPPLELAQPQCEPVHRSMTGLGLQERSAELAAERKQQWDAIEAAAEKRRQQQHSRSSGTYRL